MTAPFALLWAVVMVVVLGCVFLYDMTPWNVLVWLVTGAFVYFVGKEKKNDRW